VKIIKIRKNIAEVKRSTTPLHKVLNSSAVENMQIPILTYVTWLSDVSFLFWSISIAYFTIIAGEEA
jgi:hypothetical protein